MKLCKDCKWCVTDGHIRHMYRFAKCSHPKISISEDRIDPVTGQRVASGKEVRCSIARKGGFIAWLFRLSLCGSKARLWEENKNNS